MALAYTPPGVNIQEFSNPVVAPLLAVPASVCLVGLAGPTSDGTLQTGEGAGGVITTTEALVLTGTNAISLTGVPSGATQVSSSIVSVMDAINPENAPAGYVANVDYSFSSSNHTITRISNGAVPDGQTVYVTYTYTPADYFTAIRLDNMQDIESRFGPALFNNSIHSPLTYAAQIAFENGASNVVLQPVFFNNAGTKQQPTNAQHASASTWASTLVPLRDLEDINVIVPVVGQSQASVGDATQLAIIQSFQDHIKFMRDNDQMIVGIVGEDSSSSSSVGQKATILSHANTLAARYAGLLSEQIVYLAPSKFSRALPNSTGTTLNVGGQYVAAAIAGMIAARPVSSALTRKLVSGFVSVLDSRTKTEKNTDAANGLMVIEQRGFSIVVRHAVTLDTTATVRRELSVVRAKHRMIESVKDTIDNSIIGQVVADGDAPHFVAQTVVGVLSALRSAGDLVDFSDVQARTLSLDPTHIEVRFSYKPAFPVNYVTISFSLDLTTGNIVLPSTQSSTVSTF